MAEMEAPESNGGFSFGKLVLFVCAAFMILALLQKAGIKSVDTEETTENIDFKSAEYQNRKPEIRSASRDADAIEGASETVSDITEQFGRKPGQASDNQPLNSERVKLTADEQRYYNAMKAIYSTDPALRNRPNWLAELKASRKAYRMVEQTFNQARQSDDQTIMHLMATPALADQIITTFVETFGVSEQMCRTFRGKEVSDWAIMLERWRLTNPE